MNRIWIALATSLCLAAAIGCGDGHLPAANADAYAYPNTSNGGQIFVVPKGSGAPSILVSGQSPHNLGGGFAFDGTTAYYTDQIYSFDGSVAQSTSLVSLPIAGGTPTTLLNGSDDVIALGLDAESVYFIDLSTDLSQTAIAKVPIGGGAMQVLAANASATLLSTLAVGGGYVYWTDGSGTVSRVATSGGAVESVATNQGQIAAIAADDSGVYWADEGQPSIDCGASGGSIVGVPAGTPEPITLATGLDNVSDVTVFGGVVYFSFAGPLGCDTFQGSAGQVARVASGTSAPLATGLEHPWNLYLTPQAAYYTTVSDPQTYALAPHALTLTP